ncbi:MAG: hypothetical protein U0836_18380 [Pirellulales bacterium]
MAAIDYKLHLATRELRTLIDRPGDWRPHAARIVERCRKALDKAQCGREARELSPFCHSVEPAVAIQAIEEMVQRRLQRAQA